MTLQDVLAIGYLLLAGVLALAFAFALCADLYYFYVVHHGQRPRRIIKRRERG
ncbi:hypothetical protein KW797_02830 [Candidatus Parcubacteria bacterium]|nr:hypothetical protein [Candidatus Parcubacteria bacterium]